MQYDYTVFYYAYSTMAQTLASAFGFLGAVVLFQIQNMEAQAVDVERENKMEHRQHELVRKVDWLKADLWYSMRWTTGTVIACFLLIPLTHKNTPFGRPMVAWCLLAFTVAIAVYTLMTFRHLIKAMLPVGFKRTQK
jgi:ribose/xylose/arabinose/galactoside ABC-type transport system permease subunit